MADNSSLTLSALMASEKFGGYVSGAILIGLGLLLAHLASRAFERTMQHRLSLHQLLVWRRTIYYGLLLIFLISALREMGFQLSVLLGAAGVFSVAIGFASQTSASNLISGLFLIGEGPFAIGDTILVSSKTQGEVMSIDLLSVKLRTADNLFVRIPNEQLIKSEVTNLTRFPIRRIDVAIGVAYKENIPGVRKVLLKVLDRHPLCLDEPAPQIKVQALGASSVDLMCQAWVRRENYSNVRDDLLEAIKAACDDAGIEIPFPQVTLNASSDNRPVALTLSRSPAPAHDEPQAD